MFSYFRLDIHFYATKRVRSGCVNSLYSRSEQEKTKKAVKRRKAFWEIRDSRLRREASTTVYVNKRTNRRFGRIVLTLLSERQMTPITTQP
jgi:hypothetical protein